VIDRGFEFGDGRDGEPLELRVVSSLKKRSTRLSHEAEVGVKLSGSQYLADSLNAPVVRTPPDRKCQYSCIDILPPRDKVQMCPRRLRNSRFA
jgi:hypothetical protein